MDKKGESPDRFNLGPGIFFRDSFFTLNREKGRLKLTRRS